MKALQRVYLTADRTEAVPAGDPRASALFAHVGAEVSDKRAASIKGATDLLSTPAAKPEQQEEGNSEDLDAMLLPDLKALADLEQIDLRGATKKADIISVIRQAREAKA